MARKHNVTRIHLKTGGKEGAVDRERLMEFCLHKEGSQCVVVGWSCVYEEGTASQIQSFDDYYDAVKAWNQNEQKKYGGIYRMNAAINRFSETEEDDLFWTRDIDGNYWLCRATGKARHFLDRDLDIGALVPVEAYMYGLEVPGQIKASFTRARGGIAEVFHDEKMIAFSQHVFNKLSGRTVYTISVPERDELLDNLPPFDLEELVISYIQIAKGYYVLSNSIAKHSTTIKVECEFRSRDRNDPKRAVVQVKGGNDITIDAMEYKAYDDDGYIVYFFAPHVEHIEGLKNGVWITREELLAFYRENKAILPSSITMWESIFDRT